MQFIGPNVATICTGIAASMSAVLLCAGEKGKRSGLTHSRVMIHQPLGGAQGQASDIEITAREIGKLKKELYEMLPIEVREMVITCSYPWKFDMQECGKCNKCLQLIAVKKACEEW